MARKQTTIYVEPMLRSAWWVRLAFSTVVVAAVLASTGASQAAAARTCPKLTHAQVTRTVGFSFVSLGKTTSNDRKLPSLTCFYTLSRNAAVILKVYKGVGAYGTVKQIVDNNIGTENMVSNNSAPGTCTPAWGQCKDGNYFGHESPFAGLGQTALAFPGSRAAGALVMYIARGETFLVQSNGPLASPGPGQARLIAFSRLLLRIHFSLAG
ncbi:MAG: hypothetical protein ABI427_04635 [Solirubrobacteraceae bacterium]